MDVINKFDKMLFLILLSLAAGSIGGALIPTRVLAILFIPFLDMSVIKTKYSRSIYHFFIVWLLYCIFSLIWTSDISQGLKEIVYYPIHMLLFLEMLCFSRLAKKPLKSITNGWIAALVITSFIAMWELFTGNHLSISKLEEDSFNAGGYLINHMFASVTFGNYNGYVTFLVYGLPVLLYHFLTTTRISQKILCILLLSTTCYTLFMNSSRGGLLSLLIIFIVYLIRGLKLNDRGVRFSFYIVSVLALLIIYYYWDILSIYLSIRTNTNSYTEDARWGIWRNAIACLCNSFFIGTGIGSIITSMKSVAKLGDVIIPHNLFLEYAVQYGFVLTICVISFLCKLFKKSLSILNPANKSLTLAIFCSLPFVSIIDSSYLLNPSTWVYFATLTIFTYNEFIGYSR